MNRYEIQNWFTLEEVITKLFKELLIENTPFKNIPLYRLDFNNIFYKGKYKNFPIWDIKKVDTLIENTRYHFSFINKELKPSSVIDNFSLIAPIIYLETNITPFEYTGFFIGFDKTDEHEITIKKDGKGYPLDITIGEKMYGYYAECDFYYYGDDLTNIPAEFYEYCSIQDLKPYINELWQLIYSRYKSHYVFYELNDEMSESKIDDFVYKLMNLMSMTYDKYAPLLSLYKENESKLMDDIKASSKGKVRFNDTPQDGGEYADDSHTSNITQSETENATSGATPIERLDEIKRKISMLYKEWSDEFDVLFIEEGNI